jgi:hypothetical protein
VTGDKDLVLEENPMGQLFGFGPEIPLVSSYETHPIVTDMKNTFTGFPVARSLTIKNTDKSTVTKLFSTTDRAIATTKLNTNEVNPADPNNKKGPFTLGAAGSYNPGPFCGHRKLRLPHQRNDRISGQSRLGGERGQLALFG